MFPDSTCWPAIAGAEDSDAGRVFLERAGLRVARFVPHSSLCASTLYPQARRCSPEIGRSFAFLAKWPAVEGFADDHGLIRALHEKAGEIAAKKGQSLPSQEERNGGDDLKCSAMKALLSAPAEHLLLADPAKPFSIVVAFVDHTARQKAGQVYLETVARQTGMSYLAGQFQAPKPIPACSSAAIVARASALTPVLDEILHHQAPPPIRWGINE